MRRLPSWIEGFYDYTNKLPSPPLFRKWAAISTIAGALERKVWVRSMGSNLYPNLYVVIVGEPGVGKTVLTSQVARMWSTLSSQVPGDPNSHHVAPSSVTKASLIDALRDAERRLIRPNSVPSIISFNSLLICSNELGVLIPAYENDFMNTLTDIYDGHPYGERRRTKDLNFVLERPQLNMLAATTPSYLNNIMPEGAWDQGFISRVILIFSGETIRRPLFDETQADQSLNEDLMNDLKIIGDLYGKMSFTEEAGEAISKWHLDYGPPQPDHPKLHHYNTRRTAHLLKLCMVASAAMSDDLIITREHYEIALSWLLEAETFMPDIFKAMKAGGDRRAMEELWHFAYSTYIKDKKPIPEFRLISFLSEKVPAHNVGRILEIMEKAKFFDVVQEPKVGKCYKPRAKGA